VEQGEVEPAGTTDSGTGGGGTGWDDGQQDRGRWNQLGRRATGQGEPGAEREELEPAGTEMGQREPVAHRETGPAGAAMVTGNWGRQKDF